MTLLDGQNDYWFHVAHGLHDSVHHKHHRPLDVCVPLWSTAEVARRGLDVERLAEAMYGLAVSKWLVVNIEVKRQEVTEYAATVAAEYARLAAHNADDREPQGDA